MLPGLQQLGLAWDSGSELIGCAHSFYPHDYLGLLPVSIILYIAGKATSTTRGKLSQTASLSSG